MSQVAKALGQILGAYATVNLGTYGTDILIGVRESPVEGIFLTAYDAQDGDLEPDPVNGYVTFDEFTRVQVIIRGKPSSYNDGTLEAKARAAREAITAFKKTQGSLKLYDVIPLQPPTLLKPLAEDERNLINYVFNVQIYLEKY